MGIRFIDTLTAQPNMRAIRRDPRRGTTQAKIAARYRPSARDLWAHRERLAQERPAGAAMWAARHPKEAR